MAWHRCLPTQPCDRRVSAEHLVELDGANGAAWLALMDSLSPLNDTGGIDIALARAAQAPTFDLRRGSIYVHLYPALAEMLPSEECWEQLSPRLRESVGGEMTRESVADLGAQLYENLYMPPGFSLEFNCQGRKGRRLTPSRRRDCVAVLERLANQPSIPDREKGLRMLIRLLGQDGSAQWREEYRRVLWLRQQAQYVLYEPGSAAQIWAGGEINYYLAILQERGSWPPPPDWLPEREFARNLILEGR